MAHWTDDYLTINDLYKKLGELVAAGKGDKFARIDTEYDGSIIETTMMKNDLNKIEETETHIIIYSEV